TARISSRLADSNAAEVTFARGWPVRTNSVCNSSSRSTRSLRFTFVFPFSLVPGAGPRARRGNSLQARHLAQRFGGAHDFEANRICSPSLQRNTLRHMAHAM